MLNFHFRKWFEYSCQKRATTTTSLRRSFAKFCRVIATLHDVTRQTRRMRLTSVVHPQSDALAFEMHAQRGGDGRESDGGRHKKLCRFPESNQKVFGVWVHQVLLVHWKSGRQRYSRQNFGYLATSEFGLKLIVDEVKIKGVPNLWGIHFTGNLLRKPLLGGTRKVHRCPDQSTTNFIATYIE